MEFMCFFSYGSVWNAQGIQVITSTTGIKAPMQYQKALCTAVQLRNGGKQEVRRCIDNNLVM